MRILIIILLSSLLSCNNKEVKDITVKPDCNKKDIDTNRFNCYDGNQYEMNMCAYNEYKYNDSLLNIKYNKLINKLNSDIEKNLISKDSIEYKFFNDYKKKLIKSQRNWIKYRDTNAEIKGKLYDGGTMESLIFNNQLTLDTKNRVLFLNGLIDEFN